MSSRFVPPMICVGPMRLLFVASKCCQSVRRHPASSSCWLGLTFKGEREGVMEPGRRSSEVLTSSTMRERFLFELGALQRGVV